MVTDISSQTFVIKAANQEIVKGRAIRKIFVNSDTLKLAKSCAGDIAVLIAVGSSQSGSKKPFAVGTIWPSLELANDVVEVANTLLLTAHVSEGSKVILYSMSSQSPARRLTWLPALQETRRANAVQLREININNTPVIASPYRKTSEKGKQRDWLTLFVREILVDLKYVSSTQVVQVQYEGKERLFSVASVSQTKRHPRDLTSHVSESLASLNIDDAPIPSIYIVDWDTIVTMEDQGQVSESKPSTLDVGVSEQRQGVDAYASVGGLDEQVAQIRDLIEIPLRRPDLFRHFGLKPPRGLLLHGPPGTGKTHLARAISASTGSSVLTVNGPELTSAYHGETEASLRRVFAAARARAPCIIILDEVDAICPRREDDAGGEVEKRVVATLLTEMDGVTGADDARVVVVATTNRPNAIDPALRRPGRFDREIEIGVPDLNARISIMNVLLTKTPHNIAPDELYATASRAHGYVGADLAAVVREAGTLAIKRFLASASSSQSPESAHLTAADLAAALPTVRPSALRAHAIAAPPVRFADIGGLAGTIARLRECVEWPLVHRERFARLGVRASKGVLLCGPPGCSKTVLVRATATESGVNFVAVRGPELLNKYVGESERAVREIFRKARSAAPSIIFFDEVDALATARSSASDDGGTHEGVLFSLLNEMDGVEELVGVTVIGATNRPEALDPALMRPGRLDRILYVGPPDFAGRVEILRIRTSSMAVDPALDLDNLAVLTDGCSGAEITAMCQEAALIAMREDINTSFVPQRAFVAAAKTLRRQITPEMLRKFERWRNDYGVSMEA
ncbi:AAA-domain-containing protein [Multifurca ochricompacta]|uniref:AAA-domain-containing protein n=1 Tax=Multifurca ochricompacta TaxID=376703 RepID=A0AAD4QKA7_9AGAM|nr:AAA-domain-containing protein [Multifurca ochricompacta]